MAETTKPTPEELAAKVAQLEAQLLKEREDNDKLNKELLQKIEEQDAQKAGALPVVTLDTQKYQIVVPKFSIAGTNYTYKDITSGSELLKTLVDLKSGVIEKIVEAQKEETK